MNNPFLCTAVATCLWTGFSSAQSAADSNSPAPLAFYEMRTYYAAPGKLNELHARFRDHTIKLFENHGIHNVGYWVPVENPDQKLIYILAYPSREAREKSWKEFVADPEWQKAAKQSEMNGRLVAKAESLYLRPTAYSPTGKPADTAEPRLFELRTYTAAADKLTDLNNRFRDHTLQLFAKHGIANVAYWTPADKDKGAENTLIYILAHKDKAAAEQSWKAFRADPDWTAAKSASEVNGPLTVTNGVKSVYMKATDYSPMK
jgi:hypothetical protein